MVTLEAVFYGGVDGVEWYGIDLSTGSEALRRLASSNVMELVPLTLHKAYTHWNYEEIISAVLPDDIVDETPGSFSQAGHLAHLTSAPPTSPTSP